MIARNKCIKHPLWQRIVLVASSVLISSTVLAVEPNPNDEATLDAIHQMRVRQESEENVVRVIQQPVTVVNQTACSPAEMARQRLRDLGAKEKTKIGDITVEAGHGEVAVTDNHGQIDNSVNVQMNTPNEDRKCY